MGNKIQPVSEGARGALSAEAVQDAIFRLSRRTERLDGMKFHPFQIEVSDIENLDQRLHQAANAVKGVLGALTISVNYIDHRSEKHSGIDRFKMHGTARNRVVESIDISYEMVVQTSGGEEPRMYGISVGVRSQVGVVARLKRTNASEFERRLFRDIDRGTGRYSIRYVDYMVARNIETAIGDWFDGLHTERSSRISGFVARFPSAIRHLSTLVLGVFSVFIVTHIFREYVNSTYALFVGTTSVLIFGLWFDRVMSGLVSKFVDWAKGSTAHSFINLSKADVACRAEHVKADGRSLIIAIGAWLAGFPGLFLSTWFIQVIIDKLTK